MVLVQWDPVQCRPVQRELSPAAPLRPLERFFRVELPTLRPPERSLLLPKLERTFTLVNVSH